MLVLELFKWWYGPGWWDLGRNYRRFLADVYTYFSIALLSKTLFAPWKRIVTPSSGALPDRLRAVADNLVSRLVGFTVRLFVLIAGLVCLVLGMIASGVGLILWPLVPLSVVGLVLRLVGLV